MHVIMPDDCLGLMGQYW